MRIIDADLLECDTEWDDYEDGFTAYSRIQIENAPSIDIVRCGECKHRFTNECKWKVSSLMADNDYCSYGERREP